MITSKDLEKYIGVLPYDSELFGVYQSLLGWKAKRAQARFQGGMNLDKSQALKALTASFVPKVKLHFDGDRLGDFSIQPGTLVGGGERLHDSYLMTELAKELPPLESYSPDIWPRLLRPARIAEVTEQQVPRLIRTALDSVGEVNIDRHNLSPDRIRELRQEALIDQLSHESSVAGTLMHLVENKQFGQLRDLFYVTKDHALAAAGLLGVLQGNSAKDAYLDINSLDPTQRAHLESVGLSPISVVHLFRQYFFEFGSFLGTPVGHVWLSPGSNVELIEVSTRRRYEERVIEEATETIVREERQLDESDEFSDSVKDDNRSDIAFGATGDVHQGWIGGEANASASFDMKTTQARARETFFKRSRNQSERVSSEIRKSFKSTFRTVTETTDTSSKRYLLNNATDKLINYEMRRKMRQVGVQVQDVGTYLCWQTYVDDPGRELGLGQLLHIGKEPDASSLRHPEELPLLAPFTTQKQLSIPFQQISEDAGDKDEGYRYGTEVDEDTNEGQRERIRDRFTMEVSCDRANHVLHDVTFETNGESVDIDHSQLNIQGSGSQWTFTVVLAFVNFRGKDALNIGATLHWQPLESANQDIVNANKTKLSQYDAQVRAAYEKEFIEAARERVTMASKVRQRPYDDLREEERIVVYRALIQDLLTKGIPQPDDRSRHVVAELINAIFDVDKMLYFVSPEWWRPRLHRSHQELGKPQTPPLDAPRSPQVKAVAQLSASAAQLVTKLPKFGNAVVKAAAASGARQNPLLASSTVGWGGVKNWRADNYYITDESDVARLGSSLGWLMQLDGDNLRNAFLNAPWVKAVLPIRPGMEEAALNWLTKVEGMNGIGADDVYRTNNPEEVDADGNPLNGQPMFDVLRDLARQVAAKHKAATVPDQFPKADPTGPANPVLVDAANTVTATPISRVYEHGFYPLVGGFRNNVGDDRYTTVDQWVEILPTDQVVPVEVAYDPKTGQLL